MSGHPMLPAYEPAARTAARYRVLYGGAGSGKSVFAAMDHLATCERSPGERVLVLRKVARTVRHSTFQLFLDILGGKEWSWGWTHVQVNKTEMSLTWPNGSSVIHAGLDDVDKLKSVAGVTRIWIEEATELDDNDLAQVDLRLRGVPAERVPQLTYTFNPTPTARRIFTYLGVSTADLPKSSGRLFGDGSIYVQHTTFRDNPHVGPEYVAVFAKLSPSLQAVYERGELVEIDAPDQLIRYEWVKAAFEREPEAAWSDGHARMGADIARFGDDETVLAVGTGYLLEHVEPHLGQRTSDTGARIVTLGRERGVLPEYAAGDSVGLGSGAIDAAATLGYELREFVAGEKPVEYFAPADGRATLPDELRFNNLRSQAWWYYRAQLEAGTIAYAQDLGDEVRRKLQEDLLAPRYRIGREKVVEVEPKDSSSPTWGIKRRLGRSPDYADADVMRVFVDHIAHSVPQFYVPA